jgi:hypothetical protein
MPVQRAFSFASSTTSTPFSKATHSMCMLKMPTYLESNSRIVRMR